MDLKKRPSQAKTIVKSIKKMKEKKEKATEKEGLDLANLAKTVARRKFDNLKADEAEAEAEDEA